MPQKVDADQIVIPNRFGRIVEALQRNGLSRCLYFQGINLWSMNGQAFVDLKSPFTLYDQYFFPVSKKTYFVHQPNYEVLYHNLESRNAWVLIYHLKGMKKNRGLGKLTNATDWMLREVNKYYKNQNLVSWEEFSKEYYLNDIPSPKSLGIGEN